MSVFQVADRDEARTVAILYVFTVLGLERPDNIDYLLIPNECLIGMGLVPQPVPDQRLHVFLSERHYEIGGLDEQLSDELARQVLISPRRQARRISKAELAQQLKDLLMSDADLPRLLKGDWAAQICAT